MLAMIVVLRRKAQVIDRLLCWVRPCCRHDAAVRVLWTLEAASTAAAFAILWRVGRVAAGPPPPGELFEWRLLQVEERLVEVQAMQRYLTYLLITNLTGIVVALFLYIARRPK